MFFFLFQKLPEYKIHIYLQHLMAKAQYIHFVLYNTCTYNNNDSDTLKQYRIVTMGIRRKSHDLAGASISISFMRHSCKKRKMEKNIKKKNYLIIQITDKVQYMCLSNQTTTSTD